MIFVGGPSAGRKISEQSIKNCEVPVQFEMEPGAHANTKRYDEKTGRELWPYIHTYVRREVTFAFSGGRITAWAMVHESIQDEREVRRAVLSAFLADLMVEIGRCEQ